MVSCSPFFHLCVNLSTINTATNITSNKKLRGIGVCLTIMLVTMYDKVRFISNSHIPEVPNLNFNIRLSKRPLVEKD